jgi:hypothetical protein
VARSRGSRGVGVDREARVEGRYAGGGLVSVRAPGWVTCAHVVLRRLLRRRGTGAELVLRERLVTAHPAGGKCG